MRTRKHVDLHGRREDCNLSDILVKVGVSFSQYSILEWLQHFHMLSSSCKQWQKVLKANDGNQFVCQLK